MLPEVKTHTIQSTSLQGFYSDWIVWIGSKIKEKLNNTGVKHTIVTDTAIEFSVSFKDKTLSLSGRHWSDGETQLNISNCNGAVAQAYLAKGNSRNITVSYFETDTCICILGMSGGGFVSNTMKCFFAAIGDTKLECFVNNANGNVSVVNSSYGAMYDSWLDVPIRGLMDKIQFWPAQFSIYTNPKLFRIKTGISPFPYLLHDVFQSSIGTFIVLSSSRTNEGVINALVYKIN